MDNPRPLELLKQIKLECIERSNKHCKRHKKLKRIDDRLDILCTCLSGISTALLVSGFMIHPLLIASACCSGISFVVSNVQRSYNFKNKYIQHNISYYQYLELAREINVVMSKNHLTNDEYREYIQDINNRINLFHDTELII